MRGEVTHRRWPLRRFVRKYFASRTTLLKRKSSVSSFAMRRMVLSETPVASRAFSLSSSGIALRRSRTNSNSAITARNVCPHMDLCQVQR